MTAADHTHDLIVIGAGPAGQKAAIQGAKSGLKVVVVERDRRVGGSCVYRGTIPSKTLRETALALTWLRQRAPGVAHDQLGTHTEIYTLMERLDQVLSAHGRFLADQLARNGVELQRGIARISGPGTVEVRSVRGSTTTLSAPTLVIATGSRPRKPPEIPVDHEHIYDSDSLLSMVYLPESLTVLGAGVIASEYASVFQQLGVKVTIVDRGPRPVAFMDPELSNRFVAAFEAAGGRYLSDCTIETMAWDGVSEVVTTLASGEIIRSEKAFSALGRVANVEGLGLDSLGITLTRRGHIPVDSFFQTTVPGVYAVGDVIGFPALASTSMEQGRRAVLHALDMPISEDMKVVPVGIYTIPEMSSIGMTEAEARAAHGEIRVGRACYAEVARAHIQGDTDGLLKLVARAEDNVLVGIHVIGAGAAELVHLGQLALMSGWTAERLVDTTFNFPTMAESYRMAALDLVAQDRGTQDSDSDSAAA